MSRQFSGKSRGAAGFGSPSGFGSRSSTPGAGAFGAFSGPPGAPGGSGLSYVSEPPDLSSISDPNVVVSLKNVLKKDSTTKLRALEELVAYVQAQPQEDGGGSSGGVEDAVLDAWVQVYPRTSIDNYRRVRELSHNLLLGLLRSAKKRMERRIPKVVGPWLAGTYDKDKGVSRAVTEGLSSFLATPQKVAAFWTKCQAEILQYAIDAAQETPDTLSDERSTSKDDSEAKYHRVLGGSLSLVHGLLLQVSYEWDQKPSDQFREQLDKFYSLDVVWRAATATDAFVRRQCYQLLETSLEVHSDILEPHVSRIGKILLSDAIKSNQIGSVTELMKALMKIQKTHPQIWGSKKPPLSRLRPFLEKGSQGSAPGANFWSTLENLLKAVPQETISFEAANEVLQSVKAGFSRREESSGSVTAGWYVYLALVERLLDIVEPRDAALKLAQEVLHPLVEDFVEQADPQTPIYEWQPAIAAQAAMILAGLKGDAQAEAARDLWARMAESLVQRLQSTLEEAPEDFGAAQQKVAAVGVRLFDVVRIIHAGTWSDRPSLESRERAGLTLKLAEAAASKVLAGASEVLTKGIYRPFGAARILQSALSCWFLFSGADDPMLVTTIASIFPTGSPAQMETMLSSESAPYMLSIVESLPGGRSELFKSTWAAVLTALLEHPDKNLAAKLPDKAIPHLITRYSLRLPESSPADLVPALQGTLCRRCLSCAEGKSDDWDLFTALFKNKVLSPESSSTVARGILAALGDPNAADPRAAIQAVEVLAQDRPDVLTDDDELHLGLLTRLLSLSESPDGAVASHAFRARVLMEHRGMGGAALVGVIQENLESAGPESLEVDTLIQLTEKMSKLPDVAPEALLPSSLVWVRQLALCLEEGLRLSMALTSDLAGVYFLAPAPPNRLKVELQRDRKGMSVPARMALYVTKRILAGFDVTSLPIEVQVELLGLLYITAEAVSDETSFEEEQRIWARLTTPSAKSKEELFVNSILPHINGLVVSAGGWKDEAAGGAEPGLARRLLDLFSSQAATLSPLAVYSTKALKDVLSTLVEVNGFRPVQDEEWLAKITSKKVATPATILPCIGIINGLDSTPLRSSKALNNLLNRLISDVAGASVGSLDTLLTLILLNIVMRIHDVGELPVANNRLVFAVKQITSWFDSPEAVGSKFAAEACRALRRLLPCVKGVYGPYWQKTLDFCGYLCATQAARDSEDARLPYIYASLKLIDDLERMEEPNDDLEDALREFAPRKADLVVRLLALQQTASSHPAAIVNSLLCYKVERIPLEHVTGLGDVYGLLDAVSWDVQTAAFSLLHRAIPRAQEQLSMDIVLEKTNLRLPDELLSLLLDPPTLEKYSDDALAEFPTPIRGYLLTWVVIFDAFSTASFRLREAYAENLKAAEAVAPLLDFLFDVLGHSAGLPLNLDKEKFSLASGEQNVTSYDWKVADALGQKERDMHWLLIHVYYLALKYVPGLVKTWFLNVTSKQTRVAVEAWTASYFSPVIVSETLDDVAAWAAKADEEAANSLNDGDDEKRLVIKVGKSSREVVASYEVDDQQASIAIRVPAGYPLEPVAVVGTNRVAVDEATWRSWLMTTQGVITFGSGGGAAAAIVDGLTAFRRRVRAAMRGKSECAICYSIISSDKRLPEKECGTCRHLFHRSCLYQWFQTSNQNTCPLCRNPIDYLGAPARRGRDAYQA